VPRFPPTEIPSFAVDGDYSSYTMNWAVLVTHPVFIYDWDGRITKAIFSVANDAIVIYNDYQEDILRLKLSNGDTIEWLLDYINDAGDFLSFCDVSKGGRYLAAVRDVDVNSFRIYVFKDGQLLQTLTQNKVSANIRANWKSVLLSFNGKYILTGWQEGTYPYPVHHSLWEGS